MAWAHGEVLDVAGSKPGATLRYNHPLYFSYSVGGQAGTGNLVNFCLWLTMFPGIRAPFSPWVQDCHPQASTTHIFGLQRLSRSHPFPFDILRHYAPSTIKIDQLAVGVSKKKRSINYVISPETSRSSEMDVRGFNQWLLVRQRSRCMTSFTRKKTQHYN